MAPILRTRRPRDSSSSVIAWTRIGANAEVGSAAMRLVSTD
ncbi:hypothetical protein FHX44_11990 [Pseudonocardia hierapolitana]|uniref:Uncharacterized protein n=1 Tax=Pseudonocardia hierapolitana TaxID=1128676 RepID=A0A561SJN8_9PSEU|nr:hypothetical protein FHX44_11990 [Pseudonocardia hierapolitana]